MGLTLAHTRADIWRALLESIALGTRSCIDSMEQAGLCSKDSDVYITGRVVLSSSAPIALIAAMMIRPPPSVVTLLL